MFHDGTHRLFFCLFFFFSPKNFLVFVFFITFFFCLHSCLFFSFLYFLFINFLLSVFLVSNLFITFSFFVFICYCFLFYFIKLILSIVFSFSGERLKFYLAFNVLFLFSFFPLFLLRTCINFCSYSFFFSIYIFFSFILCPFLKSLVLSF